MSLQKKKKKPIEACETVCGAPANNTHGGVQTMDEAIHFIPKYLLSSVKHEVVVGSLSFPFITHKK